MPEEPEKFSRTENKFKLTLVQMNKRFVDLETAITELRDKTKEVAVQPISPLQQKVDDLEDLIMVEQAGILELKKMLEEAKGKLEQAPDLSSAISKSNEKLNSLEKEISTLRQNVVPKGEFEDKIRKMQTDVASVSVKSSPTSLEMENLHKNFEYLNNQLKSFSSMTENNMKGLYDKIKEIESKETFVKPGIAFDVLSSKIESLKLSLDSMTKKKIEMDLKITGMEKKFDIIENNIRESVTENVTDEIKNNRKDLIATSIKVDFLEKFSKELASNMQNLDNSMKKFESLEKVTFLSKDIDNKIDKFKFIEEEMKRASSKVELMYDDMEKRLMKMSNLERNASKLNERISSLSNEFDKSKIDIANKVSSDSIKGLEKKSEERLNETISSVTKELDKSKIDIANKVGTEFIKNFEKKSEERLNDVRNKVGIMESSVHLMDDSFKKIDEKINAIDNNYRNAVQNAKKVEAKQSPQELKQVMEILKNHESRLSGFYNQINNTQNRISNLQNTVQQKFAEMKVTSDADEQVNELLNKIVFLESRLGAIESLMIKSQEVSKAQPVILE